MVLIIFLGGGGGVNVNSRIVFVRIIYVENVSG